MEVLIFCEMCRSASCLDVDKSRGTQAPIEITSAFHVN